MLGCESEAEKLYKVLNTDEYKERPYEYSDLGEGMAVIGETMWGWWKHRFLINHNTSILIKLRLKHSYFPKAKIRVAKNLADITLFHRKENF